jgi:hypothetical protein
MITHGPEYFRICIEDVKSWGTYKDRVRIRKEWRQKIKDKFPDFEKKHRSMGLAKMAAGKIKKAFPDAPIEILPMCDLYF